MSFAVRFRRELPAGVCVGVSLPDGRRRSRCRRALHPDEAALRSRVARRAARDLHRRPRRAARGDGGAGRGRRRGGAADPRRPRAARPRCRPASSASVSHKREIAVAIAARAEPTPRTTIGIDVEIPRSLRTDIAPRVLTPAERAEIAGLDPRRARRGGAVSFRGEGSDLQGAGSVGAAAGVVPGGRDRDRARRRPAPRASRSRARRGAVHASSCTTASRRRDLVLVVATVTPRKEIAVAPRSCDSIVGCERSKPPFRSP